MRSRLLLPIGLALWLSLPSAAASRPKPPPAAASPPSPHVLFKELYFAVQMAHLFGDSKNFADAVPTSAPAEILARYRKDRPDSPAALKAFVLGQFSLPPEPASAGVPGVQGPVTVHIDTLWGQLSRTVASAPPFSSLLPLPEPFVVPGGRFRELYYWDSYFTMLGLAKSGRRDLLESMVRDFAYLIDTYGHVPNGTRTYYLSRSQPPFFYAMVELLGSNDPAAADARYLPQLRREYAFWMQGAAGMRAGTAHRRVVAMPDGAILNRYWDDADTPRDESYREDVELARSSGRPSRQLYRDLRAAAESGWDFSSRWLADPSKLASIRTTEIIPADLNSLLFGLERAIMAGCERLHDEPCRKEFRRRSTMRHEAVNQYLWNPSAKSYLDYRWTRRVPVQRVSAATLYPLFVGLASRAQADGVAATVSRELLKEGGIEATPLLTHQQWDAPNGWAPLQWIAISGLHAYGHAAMAESIACRWMASVNRVYRESGKLVEKYDVLATNRPGGGGEYPTQDGFGWTNGVMRRLMADYPADADYTSSTQCAKLAPE